MGKVSSPPAIEAVVDGAGVADWTALAEPGVLVGGVDESPAVEPSCLSQGARICGAEADCPRSGRFQALKIILSIL